MNEPPLLCWLCLYRNRASGPTELGKDQARVLNRIVGKNRSRSGQLQHLSLA
jgi:hypothetical protein